MIIHMTENDGTNRRDGQPGWDARVLLYSHSVEGFGTDKWTAIEDLREKLTWAFNAAVEQLMSPTLIPDGA